ncbi:nidogen-like domain-containing protein [Ditylenchus destructor]|nr:nidogen-like domain-containing protein [Ditylenchus destructor]
MTSQSFSLIFLIALFPTAFLGVPLDRFFPYGTTHGDTDMERGDDTGSPALQLSVPFPFFDTLYSTLWVNVNGAISFAKQISTYTPVCAPVEREYSSIAPFWADIDITYTGHVFYRQSTVAQSLEKAQEEISSAFPNFAGIKLKWLLVATWLNVTDHPDCYHCAQKRNTFQAIITTDGRHSFAIFYYQNLTWTTGHADGGIDGLGGTPAQAGFDFGDGNHRMMIPGSCTGDVLKINDQSNVGDPGKWVFRVDRAAIQTAGCTQESGNVQLRISPNFVHIMMRQPIELVGPCVENGETGPKGEKFEAQIHVNGSSYAKFTCPTPFFYNVGRTRVELHVSSGQPSKTQTYDGHFYTFVGGFDVNRNPLRPKPIILDMKPDAVLLEIPESDSLNLTCRAVGYSAPSIKWRVNGTEISCTPPDCQQVSENGTGTLTLENVKRENMGIYTCVAFDDYNGQETIPRKDWIVKVIDGKPKEIPQKFRGYWKLDHSINFDAYLLARFGRGIFGGLSVAAIAAKAGMSSKEILKNADGSYSWDDLYHDMMLEKEFVCTTINCILQPRRIVFEYLPANETLIETHKPLNSDPIFDYRYTVDDGFLVMRMKWDNVKAKLFFRKKNSE